MDKNVFQSIVKNWSIRDTRGVRQLACSMSEHDKELGRLVRELADTEERIAAYCKTRMEGK